ncbi:MAG: CcmD family protein [Nitrospinae bacterium]|nr:CcmD family protein [Nitrospinota bacterium]
MSYLVAAFGVIWLAVFAYVFAIDRKCEKLEKEIESAGKGPKAD